MGELGGCSDREGRGEHYGSRLRAPGGWQLRIPKKGPPRFPYLPPGGVGAFPKHTLGDGVVITDEGVFSAVVGSQQGASGGCPESRHGSRHVVSTTHPTSDLRTD